MIQKFPLEILELVWIEENYRFCSRELSIFFWNSTISEIKFTIFFYILILDNNFGWSRADLCGQWTLVIIATSIVDVHCAPCIRLSKLHTRCNSEIGNKLRKKTKREICDFPKWNWWLNQKFEISLMHSRSTVLPIFVITNIVDYNTQVLSSIKTIWIYYRKH